METLQDYIDQYGGYLGPIKFLEEHPEEAENNIFIDLEILIR
jgi:hypothetical protein